MFERWPLKLVTVYAVVAGILLLLGGGFHLKAILEVAAAENKPFDYRMVSLIATSVILMGPGLLGIVLSRALWKGREWAYLACLSATAFLMAYIVMLLFMEPPPPPARPSMGDEVNFFANLVAAYVLLLAATWAWLRMRRRAAHEVHA